MNRSFFTALLLVAGVVVANGQAVSVKPLKSDKVLVKVKNLSEKKSMLTLRDDQGRNIHAEHLDAGAYYFKKFNLSKLEAGAYSMEYEDVKQITIYSIEVDESGIVSMLPALELTKPEVDVRHDVVVVTQGAFSRNGYDLRVVDSESNELVFSDEVEGPGSNNSRSKRYDLSSVKRGTYDLILYYGDGRSVLRTVEIKE